MVAEVGSMDSIQAVNTALAPLPHADGRGRMGCSVRPMTLKLTARQLLPYFTWNDAFHPHRQPSEGKLKPWQGSRTEKWCPVPFPNLRKGKERKKLQAFLLPPALHRLCTMQCLSAASPPPSLLLQPSPCLCLGLCLSCFPFSPNPTGRARIRSFMPC